MNYSINGFYKNHLTVISSVVAPMLDMHTEMLEVGATPGLPAEAGMRSIISLTNPLNYAAEFTWYPVVGDKGTAFSIRPATGRFSDYNPRTIVPIGGKGGGLWTRTH